jgi:hypothetical protein
VAAGYDAGVRVVVAIVFVLGFAGAARAEIDPDTRAKAEALSASARRAIADRADWAGASVMFMQAYELTKQLPYLINVAVSYRRAKLPHKSVETYRRCLAEGGAELTPELRAQIESDIANVTKESAQISVRTAGAEAAIELDDLRVGTASKDAPLVVLAATEAGKTRKLRATRDGFEPVVQELLGLRAGEVVEIVIEPKAIATTGNVRVTSSPGGAQLVLVGRGPIGRAPQSIVLAPGDYYVHATLPGYDLAREKVTVFAGRDHDAVLKLRKTPPSWWTKHKLEVYIAVGALVASGAAVGGYYMFKPEYDGTRLKVP